ncbi:MAG: Hsp70 family protein, partial [Clostridiales bacterium]|nr:Hsp70 family protein [Clostridiales bacterium]
GGTFDISILEIGDGVFEVLATAGDNRLGGDDFDNEIIKWLTDSFKKDNGIDLSKDRAAMQRLKEAAEKAKIELSSVAKTTISLPFITADAAGPKHLEYELSKPKFESMISYLIDKTVTATKQALSDAGFTSNDIQKVILVGGSTRVPAVVDAVKTITGKEPFKGINPDECVALGAAIQAGVLAGEVKDVILMDVTPLSLGIETMGGIFSKILDRNTTIPFKKSQVFSTASDNQPGVDIHILQGEREVASGNKTIGRFELTGIPPARRGVPQIEVTFDIDANGILSVTAKDKGTGKEQNIIITASSNLSDDDINKAMKEAEKFAKEDHARKELVDAKNAAENIVLQVEKVLSESGDKIGEADKEALNREVEATKEASKGDDLEAIRAAAESLGKVSNEVFGKLYQQNAGNPESDGSDGNGQA